MNEIFIDSFFWMAVYNSRDPFHARVVGMPKPFRAVTTQAVQLEVMDAFCSPRHRPLAADFWTRTNSDPDLTVIRFGDELLERAALLFENRKDKDWSMTDCISFLVMQDRNIKSALTGDRHFEQAGFEILLK